MHDLDQCMILVDDGLLDSFSCHHLSSTRFFPLRQPLQKPWFSTGFSHVYDYHDHIMGVFRMMGWDNHDDQPWHVRHHHDDAAAETKGLRAALQAEIWGKCCKIQERPCKKILRYFLLAILVEVGDPKNVPVDMILTGNTWRWEHIILQKKDAPTTGCNHQVTSRRKKSRRLPQNSVYHHPHVSIKTHTLW